MNGHNTPNGDCVSCVHGVNTFAAYSVCNGGGLRGYGLRPIKRVYNRSRYACMFAMCGISAYAAADSDFNFAPRGA